MKYPYIVNKNGIWYPSGAEVPEEIKPHEQKRFTKSSINRMSTAELQALAAESDIENASETSNGELKKLLIEHFGL